MCLSLLMRIVFVVIHKIFKKCVCFFKFYEWRHKAKEFEIDRLKFSESIFIENMRILSIKTAVLKSVSYLKKILCKFWFWIVLGVWKNVDEKFFHYAGMVASFSLGIILKVFHCQNLQYNLLYKFKIALTSVKFTKKSSQNVFV